MKSEISNGNDLFAAEIGQKAAKKKTVKNC